MLAPKLLTRVRWCLVLKGSFPSSTGYAPAAPGADRLQMFFRGRGAVKLCYLRQDVSSTHSLGVTHSCHPQDIVLLPILRAAMCSCTSFYIPLTSQLQESIHQWANVTRKEINEGHLPVCLLSCQQKQMPLSHVDDCKAKPCQSLCSSCCAVAVLVGINTSVMGKGLGTQLL